MLENGCLIGKKMVILSIERVINYFFLYNFNVRKPSQKFDTSKEIDRYGKESF